MTVNHVKARRQEIGLSQAELSRRTRINAPNLSAIENGQREAWPRARRRLARALKVTESELFPEGNDNGNQ